MANKAIAKASKAATKNATQAQAPASAGKAHKAKRHFAPRDEQHLERISNASACVGGLRDMLSRENGLTKGEKTFEIIRSWVKQSRSYGFNNLMREVIQAK